MTTDQIQRPTGLSEWVLSSIEKLIFSGELPPGSHLNENQISITLNVSRSPVREAIRSLSEMGLLEIKQNRGSFVRTFDSEEINEMYHLRFLLAKEAGILAATRITPSQIDTLQHLIDEIDNVTKTKSVEEFFPLNMEFHRIIIEASGNRRLAKTYISLQREHRLYRQQSLLASTDSQSIGLNHQIQSNEEHRNILESLKNGDAKRVGQLLKSHDQNGRSRSEEISWLPS